MPGKPVFTAEQLAWIKAMSDLPRAELHALLKQAWPRSKVTVDQIKNLCSRKKWKAADNGSFPKGHVPANKGQKMAFNENSAKTQFKPGHMPANRHGPGHENINKDGYAMICIDQPNPWTGVKTWMVPKHRYLWEQANGPVPEGHRLKCLDGNRQNSDPSNWKALPNSLAPRLNGRFGRGYDAAPAALKPIILATAELEDAARRAKRAGGAA